MSGLAKDLSLFETDLKLIQNHINDCLREKKTHLAKKYSGTVVMRWKINDNGHMTAHQVDHKKSTIKNNVIQGCVLSSIKAMTYSLGKTNEIRIYKQVFTIKNP